jgi:triacylglycerol lipase
MKPTKKILQNSIQLQINGAGGLLGPVVPVLDKVEFFDFEDVDGQVGRLGNDMYICFHGSNDIRDWVDNINFKKVPFIWFDFWKNHSKVHLGFFMQYITVRKYLLDKLTSYRKEGELGNIIITGHSLGGALATLCSADFTNYFINVTPVIFASPRVGNGSFAKYYMNSFPEAYRFNYMNDLVGKLPPTFFNYWHVGNCIELANLGEKYKYNLKHIWEAIFGNIKDHDVQNYKKGVDELDWE